MARTKGFRSVLAFAVTVGFAAAAQALPSAAPSKVLAPTPSAAVATQAGGHAPHALEKADLAAWLDGLLPYALKTGDIAGSVVVVVKDGQVLFEKGYGYANVAKKSPMDPAATMVRPGSTSKLFTWTAVMQLVEQHKLDLDRDVNDYLDFNIPHKDGKAVTLRDLMNHRAGFEEGLKDLLATDPKRHLTTERYVKEHPRPELFTPGDVPAYSNYGVALAGYIVQRVSGESFDNYVEQHIFQPLGMEHTTFEQPLPARFQSALSQGYMTASSPPRPYEFVETAPAGSASTTADDMARFMIAHLQDGRFGDKRILSDATATLMHSPSESALPGFGTMAHGFFYETHNGRIAIGHGGDTVVFHTELELLPQENVGIFYNFNSRVKNDAVYALREALFNGFMNRYFPAPVAPALPPAPATAHQDAQEIAGAYQSSRRIEHSFLSFFYILQQSSIAANADGTIEAPAAPGLGGTAKFREVAPNLWRDTDSTRELALQTVDGVKTVIDSEDPTSVLQAVPAAKSATLNVTVLLGSIAILFWTLILWVLSPLLRRGDRAAIGVSPEVRRLRLIARIAAAVDAIYLVGWALLMAPLLTNDLQVFSTHLDPVVRMMQLAGLLVVAAAGVGIWVAWRMFQTDSTWLSRLWNVAVAASLLGIVWIAFMGNLLSFNLNY
jgi:CubicO group peptidase (beta-lactamase class C family)